MERYVLRFENTKTGAITLLEPYTARKTAIERCDAWRDVNAKNNRNILVNVIDRKKGKAVIY